MARPTYLRSLSGPKEKGMLILLVLLWQLSCTNETAVEPSPTQQFATELTQLKDYFKIPGLVTVIEQDGKIMYESYLGQADIDSNTKVDATTLFPVASLTKVFSGILAVRLEEQGKISLDAPVKNFLPAANLPDSVQVKHLLSHTSQGEIGSQFYYSSRFGLLTQVLEKATNRSFSELMHEEIFVPLQLEDTFLLKDSTQLANSGKRIATPYRLEEDIEKGSVEYGYSASAGIVSNPRDLLKLSHALDSEVLLTAASRKKMTSPFKDNLPYGYGIFTQKIEGVPVLWAYGQYDCYASLFVKIPSKNCTLIIFANNNVMNDAARLIYGDLTASLFALSFLKNFILDRPKTTLIQKPDSIVFNTSHPEFQRKVLLAQALSASFMARYEPQKRNTSSALLESVFKKEPNYLEYANLTLLHNLSFLKDVAFFMELGELKTFDVPLRQIGNKLLRDTPNNPYAHAYLGTFYDRKGAIEKAEYHFRAIVENENFSRNWYTVEAEDWLKERME